MPNPFMVFILFAGMALATRPVALAADAVAAGPAAWRLWAGCYGDAAKPGEAPAGGIYAVDMDPITGQMALAGHTPARNTSFLALDPLEPRLYAVHENYGGGAAVSAYGITGGNQEGLMLRQAFPISGDGPCHVAVAPLWTPNGPGGHFLAVANFGGGNAVLLSLWRDPDRPPMGPYQEAMDPLSAVRTLYRGTDGVFEFWATGPGLSDSADPDVPPPVSHIHSICFSPDGRHLLTVNLGLDQIIVWPVNSPGMPDAPYLETRGFQMLPARPGDGPRFSAFHPSGRLFYVVNELSGAVSAWSFGPEPPDAELLDGGDPLPEERSGAHIEVSPDGRFVYVSFRQPAGRISVFTVDPATGRLTRAGAVAAGAHPRHFSLSPDGRFLVAADQHGGRLMVFSRDATTGFLADTGLGLDLPGPACAVFTTFSEKVD